MTRGVLAIACAGLLQLGCSHRRTVEGTDGATTSEGGAAGQRDGAPEDWRLTDAGLTVKPPVCSSPCPKDTHTCIAAFPDGGKGLCLKKCSATCQGGQPGGLNEMCHVVRGGTRYCMYFCQWKGMTFTCPKPDQICVDAYMIPGHELKPGYEGATVCVPK